MLDERSIRYPGWRVVAASSLCVFVSFASLLVYTFGVFLKPLVAEFHWSREAVSFAMAVAPLAVAACSPLIGYLLDRFPARRIIIPCLIVFGLAFASLSTLTDNLWHFYAVFLVLGIVGNGTAQLAYSRTIVTWFQERRGAAFAALMTGGALGAMILPLVAQSLIGAVGWRGAYALLGGVVVVIGVPAALNVRERPIREQVEKKDETGASVAQGLRSRVFWVLVTVLFLCSISQNGAISHLPALLTDRGIPAGRAALAASALGGATLAGRLLTGWLLDRYFAPKVSFCLLVIAALGTYRLSSAHSLMAAIAGAACIGFGMGGEADVTPYLLAKYFGLRSFSTLYGLTWTAYAIAGAIGPVIMGRAFDLTGSYERLLSRLAILTLAAAALMLFLPRYPANRDAQNVSLAEIEAPAEA